MGGRSCLVGPCCLGRLRLPVRPCPVCTALPAPRPLHGAAPLRGLRRPGGGAARGRAPQAPSGPPTYRELRSPPPTRWVAPARPSGRAPPRVLGGGCWGVHTIAGGMRRAHGAGARCSECGLSGGLRGGPGYASPVLFGCASFTEATRGRSGWGDLTPQGLTPCKKRQASLGALTHRPTTETALALPLAQESPNETLAAHG